MLYTAQGPLQPTDMIEIRQKPNKLALAEVNGFIVEGLLIQNAPLAVMINQIEDLGYLYQVTY